MISIERMKGKIMLQTIITAIMTFVSTTIDDIFVVTVLFADAKTKRDRINIYAGEYIGIMTTFALGLAGAFAASFIPGKFIGLLGFVPIIMAVIYIIKALKGEDDDDDEIKGLGVVSVALLSLSNGGDNIGVYIPVLTGLDIKNIILTAVIFLICIALFCILAQKIGSVRKIRNFVEKYKQIIIPGVLIILGIMILAEHYL